MDSPVLSEDGVYDPAHFNDRLLLGLKGTMRRPNCTSSRHQAAGRHSQQSQTGRVAVSSAGRLSLQPNASAGAGSRQTGSAEFAVLLRDLQPHRFGDGDDQDIPSAGPSVSASPEARAAQRRSAMGGTGTHSRALQVLHNPRYAGAFVFGRTHALGNRTAATRFGNSREISGYCCPICTPDTSRGSNKSRTSAGFARTHWRPAMIAGRVRRAKVTALLQGLVLCGVCGSRIDSPVPLPRHAAPFRTMSVRKTVSSMESLSVRASTENRSTSPSVIC